MNARVFNLDRVFEAVLSSLELVIDGFMESFPVASPNIMLLQTLVLIVSILDLFVPCFVFIINLIFDLLLHHAGEICGPAKFFNVEFEQLRRDFYA